MNNLELTASIEKAALACGFDTCGIVRLEEMQGYTDALKDRIAHFPDSEPMFGRFTRFVDPAQLPSWAKSVVVCSYWYGKYRIPENLQGIIGKAFCLDIRRDKQSEGYQIVECFEKALTELGVQHAAEHDYGITAMRWAAVKAGIGIVRKNNFFYTRQGSWNWLAVFLIDRDLELKKVPAIKSCPEKCGLCVKACPTQALDKPFYTNGVACVGFLTGKATCAPGKKHYDKCGKWIYGCDACQDACPYNRGAWDAVEEFHGLEELSRSISYEKILGMDDGALREMLSQKFWYIEPERVWTWKCNILNAMHNNYEGKYLPHIEAAMQDPQKEVREMAQWVFESVSVMA